MKVNKCVCCRNWAMIRENCIFKLPSVLPVTTAISAYDSSSHSRIVTNSCASSGKVRINSCKASTDICVWVSVSKFVLPAMS